MRHEETVVRIALDVEQEKSKRKKPRWQPLSYWLLGWGMILSLHLALIWILYLTMRWWGR